MTRAQQGGVPAPHPPAIDAAAYHGILGEIVREIAPHTEADPVGILAVLLSGVGNAIGRSAHALVSGTPHHARLNVMLVGPTREGAKGSAQSAAEAVLAAAIPDWYRLRRAKGLSTGEGLIKAVRDERIDKEAIRDKAKNIVGYQDVVVDSGVQDKRLWVVQDEFSKVIKVMGRESNTLAETLLEAWDGGNLQTLTSGNPHLATAPHISIVGHIQPALLLRHLTETAIASGFANRFLWFCVRKSQDLPDADTLDRGLLEKWGRELGAIVGEVAERLTFPLRRDEAARDLWHAVYPRFGEGTVGLLAAILARAQAQTLRLSVLYAALDLSPVIGLPHLDAALAVWEYCHNSALCIFGDETGDPVMDTIVLALREGPKTTTELHNRFNRHIAAEQLKDTLELLQERGVVAGVEIPTGGRPRAVWSLVPEATGEAPE